MKQLNTKKIVGIALFTAIVALLQLLGSFIKLGPFSISLVLVPIVVGAALYGLVAAAWLGLVFGVIVLLSGDAAVFLAINPAATILIVLVKGIAAGLVSAFAYKLIEQKNPTLAVFTSAVTCPIVNTGIFLLGCLLFFIDTMREWAVGLGFGSDVGAYMIVGLVGLNFVAEFVVNLILSPVIVRLIRVADKA